MRRISSPTIAGVRGTEFYIGVEQNQALLTVFEGTVVAQNTAGSLDLTSGQSAVAAAGRAPVITVVATAARNGQIDGSAEVSLVSGSAKVTLVPISSRRSTRSPVTIG